MGNVSLSMTMADIASTDCSAISDGVNWDKFYEVQSQIDKSDVLYEIYLKKSAQNLEAMSANANYAESLCMSAALDAELLGFMK